jgi:hypothetical protein
MNLLLDQWVLSLSSWDEPHVVALPLRSPAPTLRHGTGLKCHHVGRLFGETRRPPCPCHHLPASPDGHRWPDAPRHPRRAPPIATATVMRMTESRRQAGRKRPDRGVRRAGKRRRQPAARRASGPIRPTPTACATADALRGGKRLSCAQIRAMLRPRGMPFGHCRFTPPRALPKRDAGHRKPKLATGRRAQSPPGGVLVPIRVRPRAA